MSQDKVEASQNIGPHPFYSIKGASSSVHGDVFNSANYTKHSYQVICSNISASTNLAFFIFGTNENSKNWQKLAGYLINSSRNSNGLLHFDVWNFKYVKCALIGDFDTARVSVIEKHNA